MIDEKMIECVAAAVEKHIREYAETTYGTVAAHARGTLSVDAEIDPSELARAAILAYESAKLKEAEDLKLGSRLTVEGVDAVVVPVEPSREMRVSGRDKLRSLFVEMACEADAEDAYRAMLSAAGDGR